MRLFLHLFGTSAFAIKLGSARNGRAIETRSESPLSRMDSAISGVLIRFVATWAGRGVREGRGGGKGGRGGIRREAGGLGGGAVGVRRGGSGG